MENETSAHFFFAYKSEQQQQFLGSKNEIFKNFRNTITMYIGEELQRK